MKRLRATLKLIIAGNHDFTLDVPIFKKKIEEAKLQEETELVAREYGESGEARSLFDEAKDAGIRLLDEGAHRFELQNGAVLDVYASPFTPSSGEGGFTYPVQQGHEYAIPATADIVITHAPPHGIMDRTRDRQRAGSGELFAAVAKVRPLVHCFGHVHEGWGAKLVKWREELSEQPSHLRDIDHEKSVVVGSLAGLRKGEGGGLEDDGAKGMGMRMVMEGGCCVVKYPEGRGNLLGERTETLFVNAAMKDDGDDDDDDGNENGITRFPWVVDIELSRWENSCRGDDDMSGLVGHRNRKTRKRTLSLVTNEDVDDGEEDGGREKRRRVVEGSVFDG